MDADPRDQQIRELQTEVTRLQAENQALREQIKALEQRLEELERTAMRQAAPFRRDEKHRKPGQEQGRPGRKPGHPPAKREIPDHVDEHFEVPLKQCPIGQGPVGSLEPREQYIEDLPPTRPHVTQGREWAIEDCRLEIADDRQLVANRKLPIENP